MSDFNDNLYNIYSLQAFFLAAEAIAEFECEVASQIINILVLLSFGDFDIEKHILQHSTFSFCTGHIARKALHKTNRRMIIEDLRQRINYYRERLSICLKLEEQTSDSAFSAFYLAHHIYLLELSSGNSTLTENIIINMYDYIQKNNRAMFYFHNTDNFELENVIQNVKFMCGPFCQSNTESNNYEETGKCENNYKYKQHLIELKNLSKVNPFSIFDSPDYYSELWLCAQKMTYPNFYQIWHDTSSPTNAELSK